MRFTEDQPNSRKTFFAEQTKALMEFYRSSAVGNALIKSLNSLLESNKISREVALVVLEEFDQTFQLSLRDNLVAVKDLDTMRAAVSMKFY